MVHATNLIRLSRCVSAGEIRSGIERELVRSAEIDVDTDGGHVTLTGTVRSWGERDEAEAAAWRGGATSVTNNIRIEPL